MGNMIKGDVYFCEDCKLEVAVSKPCDEDYCDIMCCGQQMKKKLAKSV